MDVLVRHTRTLLDTSAVVAAPEGTARVPGAAIRLGRGDIGPRALRRTARHDYAAAVLVPRGRGQQTGWRVHTTHRAAHAHAPAIRAVPERVQRFQHVIALVHVRLRPCIQISNKHTGERAVHRLSALPAHLFVGFEIRGANGARRARVGPRPVAEGRGVASRAGVAGRVLLSCRQRTWSQNSTRMRGSETQNSDQVRTGTLSSSRENSLKRASEARAGCWARNWLRVLAAARYQLFLRGSAATP